MKKIVNVVVLVLLTSGLFAQNETDALRYSRTVAGGTSRYMSMGGAFGALGADFSCMSENPAGIAVFRKSEVTFTPSLYYDNTGSTYLGTSFNDFRYNFNLNNVGMIAAFHSTGQDSVGWLGLNIGFGYNRTNNFFQKAIIEGVNQSGSMTDYFANLAKGSSIEQLWNDNADLYAASQAWDTYLIDTLNNNTHTYHSVFKNYGETQRLTIDSRGKTDEYLFSMGANYSNKLYLGGSIVYNNAHYEELSKYTEFDTNNTIDSFASFNYKKKLVTNGSGFTLKIGGIYRPMDWLRIGFAVHTPTFYRLENRYFNSMETTYDNGRLIPPASFNRDSVVSYDLSTPLKAMGSLGFVISKIAVIGIDGEFIDYSTMRLSSSDVSTDYTDVNTTIQNHYVATGNLRAGLEIRLDNFSIRGGYGLYGNPYTDNSGTKFSNKLAYSTYSGGFGVRDKVFFFDVAYVYTQASENYYLYNPDLANVDPASMKNSKHQVMMTFGFKF